MERVDLLGLSLDLDLDRDFECERDLLPTGDTEESDCEESWWRLRLLRFLDFLDDCLGGGDLDRDLHLLLDCELSSSVTELMERLRNTLPPDLRLRLAEPRRHRILDRGRAENVGIAELNEAGALGVFVDVDFQGDVTELVGRPAGRSHGFASVLSWS